MWFSSEVFKASALDELELYRLKMKKSYKLRIILSFFVYPLLLILTYFFVQNNAWFQNFRPISGNDMMGNAYFSMFLFFALLEWCFRPKENYRHAYRNYYAELLMVDLGIENIKFKKGRIPIRFIKQSMILPTELYKSEFHMSFRHKGVKVTIAHTLCNSRNSKNNFSGSFVFVEFPNAVFHSKVIIREDRNDIEEASLVDATGLEKVGLVDPVFEGLFTVYANDQVEARFVFNPAFMEEFRSLAYNHHPLSMSFYDQSKVFILIPNIREYFNPSIRNPAGHNVDIELSKSSIRHILNLIDMLLPESYIRKSGTR